MNYFIPSSIAITKRIYSIFQEYHFDRALIVYSKSAVKNGALDRAKKYLKSNNINFYEYDKEKNIKDQITEIIKYKFNFDAIITIGGGGVIDFSKILKHFLYTKKIKKSFLSDEKYNFQRSLNDKTLLIVIVTLFGSGSESSNVSVVNHNKKKFFYISNAFIPNHVIYDYFAQNQIDPDVASKHLIDSFTHAVEALGSPLHTSISNYFANFTINNIYKLMKSIISNKNIEKKELEYLAISSFFGGLSQSNVGTGLTHALAHAAEELFQIRHASGIAHFSYFSYRHNKNINDKIYYEKIGDVDLIELIDECYEMISSSINYKNNNLSLILNNDKNILNLLKLAEKDSCWRLNIVPPNKELITKMLKDKKEY